MSRALAAMAVYVASLCFLFIVLPLQGTFCVGIGINYGRVADDLPNPLQVAHFLEQNTLLTAVKLYDADPTVLGAFSHTKLAVNVAIPNEFVPDLAALPSAQRWIRANVLPHVPSTNIVRILVGNEVLSTANRTLIANLVPAMQNLHTALVGVSLHDRVRVSSPHSLGILSSSTPPSTGKFRTGYDAAVVKPLLSFLRATDSPFMVNAYPYFGSGQETLDYALFRASTGVTDQNTGLLYTNMFDAQLDAVFSAMKLLGYGDVDIVVAETGWPSRGDAWQMASDADSARDYNRHLVEHCSSGAGTPLMPNRTFETYIFSLFDENLKPGPTSERNFGLFRPDFSPVYDIGILKSVGGEPAMPSVIGPPEPTRDGRRRWCVPKPNSSAEALQTSIDFVCGQGIDCRPIQEGGACYFPDTAEAHAAYVMNEYYHSAGQNAFDCDFGQTGFVTAVDPSYGSCSFKS